MRPRTGVGEDPKSKATAVPEDKDEARGISTDRGGLITRRGRDVWQENTPGRLVGGWYSSPGGKRASLLLADRMRVLGWGWRGWQRRSEPLRGSPDQRHQFPRRHQPAHPSQGLCGGRMGPEQGCGKGLGALRAAGLSVCPPAPSVQLGPAPCQPRSRLRAWGGAPAPGEEEDGGWRMEGGSPRPESGVCLASPAVPRPQAGPSPRWQAADVGGQTCCLTAGPVKAQLPEGLPALWGAPSLAQPFAVTGGGKGERVRVQVNCCWEEACFCTKSPGPRAFPWAPL